MEPLETRLIRQTLWLQRYSPDSLSEIETKLKLASTEIIALIANTRNKATIKKQVKELLEEAFSTFETVLINDDIPKITELAYTVTGALMVDYATKEFKDPRKATLAKLSDPNIEIMGFPIKDETKNLANTTIRKSQSAIINGFNQGYGIDEISRNITAITANVSRNQAKTLARTVILQKIEESQLEAFDYFKDDIIGWKYSSVIDGRTSARCLYMHNKRYQNKSDAPYQPKNHWNCRSLWIPIPKDERFRPENEKIVQWDSKKVNHRDNTSSTKFTVDKVKTVKAGQSGLELFKKFDKTYQRKYLGDTRYRLYSEGKATLNEMIDISKNKLVNIDTLMSRLSE